MRGENIKKNTIIKDAHIMDLAPTILHLMGIPIPKDMDGKLLEDALEEDFLKKNPISYSEAEKTKMPSLKEKILSKKDEEKIKERLRGLGYID